MNKLVEIVEKERLRRGISQDDVCSLIGVSRATWGRYLSGRSEMSIDAFLKIIKEWGGTVGPVVFEGGGVRIEYSLKK